MKAAILHEFKKPLAIEEAARPKPGADEVLIGQRLISGAVEANNLVIVYPSAREGCNELFLIRHGRLLEQRCIPHEPETMKLSVSELLKLAASLGEPPKIVGQGPQDTSPPP